MAQKRAAVYCRISDDRRGDEAGVSRVVTTAHLPAGTAYVADGTEVVAAVRTDGEIAVSGEAKFVKSVANAVDRAFFTGTGTGGQPAGITTVAAIPSVDTALTLGAFADAIASIESNGGTASVAWVNPGDWGNLSETLTGHAAVNPTGQVTRSLRGVPVVTTAHLPAGTAYVADGTEVVAAVRTDGEIAVSGEAKFANYQTQVRVVSRIAYGFPEPDAIAEIAAA